MLSCLQGQCSPPPVQQRSCCQEQAGAQAPGPQGGGGGQHEQDTILNVMDQPGEKKQRADCEVGGAEEQQVDRLAPCLGSEGKKIG
jgi:hypothetical protein